MNSNSGLEHFTQRITDLTARGEFEPALESLRNFLHSRAPKMHNEAIIQTSRYHRLRRDETGGQITREQFQIEQNRLTKSILALLDEIPRQVELGMAPLELDVAPGFQSGLGLDKTNFEQILGINNLKQISWIERGLQVSKSVCRVLTANGVGSGFLAAPDLLMTNNHVIPNIEVAAGTFIEFNYQQDAGGQLMPTVRYRLDANRFRTSPQNKLDYTLVGVQPDPTKPALLMWGHLNLNPNADPIPGEHVSIIQHPNGGLKQIVMTANKVLGRKEHLVHYTTDTMPGSSGSPVFNDVWQVVAIHHAGAKIPIGTHGTLTYANEGILMSAIKPDAGLFWP